MLGSQLVTMTPGVLFARVVAWSILAAIAFATLAPIGLRPHSGLPVAVERFTAFLITGAAFALAYRQHPLRIASLVVGAAVALELLQLLSPTRHGQLPDAGFKIAGAVCGLLLVWIVSAPRRRDYR